MIKKIFLVLFSFTSLVFGDEKIEYVHVSQLLPGQVRFSSLNVKQKTDQAIKQQNAFWDSSLQTYLGKYFDGKSLFEEKEALPVIVAPFGLVLADGHHHTLAALALKIEWLPIKKIKDLSHLSTDEFWKVAENNGWVYLYDLKGVKLTPFQSFKDLIDDPNRYFAAITARKCNSSGDLSSSTGADFPLWIKVGKDIPFIEFQISDALRQAGIEYSYEMGDQPDQAFVEKARKALLQANIPGLRVVPHRIHYSRIDSNE